MYALLNGVGLIQLTLKMKKSSINMAPNGRIPAIRMLKGESNTIPLSMHS